MDLREETERIILDGYNEANSQAKLLSSVRTSFSKRSMKAAWQRMQLSKAESS